MQVVIDTINEAYEPIQVRQVIEALHQDVSAQVHIWLLIPFTHTIY